MPGCFRNDTSEGATEPIESSNQATRYGLALIGPKYSIPMHRNVWTVSLAVWALVALPTFCAAGLLTHPCDPADMEHAVDHSHDEDESGCKHESDCERDPCRDLSVRFERKTTDVHAGDVSVDFMTELTLNADVIRSADAFVANRVPLPLPRERSRLQRSLPLLI